MLALWLSLALAGPQSIVVLGDGLVVGSSDAGGATESQSGWVAGLADCLAESAPGRFAVVDRVRPQETVASAQGVIAEALSASPGMVVVGLGAQEATKGSDIGAFEASLTTLAQRLRSDAPMRRVLLVGVVPSASSAAEGGVDKRIARWNESLSRVAVATGALHVDLWADWPRQVAARAPLTSGDGGLTDQGHARVAAAVCDAVLSWKDAAEETP